jgi:hypothetical protein
MLLGGMLMVKMGVSDHQQAPPSYPFTRPRAKMRVYHGIGVGSGVAIM